MNRGSFEPLHAPPGDSDKYGQHTEKIDIERTKKIAEHVFDVLGRSGTAVGKRADGAWPSAAHHRG